MATGDRIDPYGSFNFLIEIDGITRAFFQEASGLESAIDAMEYREGGDNSTLRKIPSITKYTNITLKRGVTDDRELFDWHKQWANGSPNAQRISGSIILLDRHGQEQVRWNFFQGWPAKWTGPSFNAQATEIAVETLEIAHEGLERV